MFFQALEAGKVDAKNGVIRGVSVITSGITAKGHNLETDATTLLQMKGLADEKGQVPVKWNHKTGADAVNGYLMNFRIEDDKLKADWHLLKNHSQYEHALELAERLPTGVGLSASFVGKNEKKAGKQLARCDDLLSVDLVATPAANPDGLFEARVDNAGGDMAENSKPDGGTAEQEQTDLNAVLGAVEDLGQRFTSFEQRLSAMEEDDDEPEEPDDPDADGEEDEEEPEDREFNSMGEVAQFLESRLEQIEDNRERREFETAFNELSGRMESLMELNQQLAGENEVMAEALQELSAQTDRTVEFSAGNENEGPKPRIINNRERQLTEFEARVEEIKAEGKDFGAAILEAQKEDSARYQRHLQAKGAFAQELGR